MRRLRENNALAMSSALSFRTIFALVPAIVLAVVVMKTLAGPERTQRGLREFLTYSGLEQIQVSMPAQDGEQPQGEGEQPTATAPAEPATRPDAGRDGSDEGDSGRRDVTMAQMIESLVIRVEKRLTLRRLGPIGVALLVWTALTLLMTLERSLNRIFQAPRSRALLRRVLVYWSVLTLGPVVLMLAAVLGDRAAAWAETVPVLSWMVTTFGVIVPAALGILLVGGVYTLMPNTRVRFRDAVGGAVIAVPLWMLAKWGFSVYVERVAAQSLYGALALVPLFLLWVNVSWWVLLFGAELAHAAANVSRLLSAQVAERVLLTPWHLLAAALVVARTQRDDGRAAGPEGVAKALNTPVEAADRLLGRLHDEGLIYRVEQREEADDGQAGRVLAVPADRLEVGRFLDVGVPDEQSPTMGGRVGQVVREVRRRCQSGIEGLTLADLLNEE